MADDFQREEIVLKLGTRKGDEANAASVAATMHGIDTLLNEIHDACDKNHEFLLKARPFKKGSFDIPLELLIIGAAALNWPIIDDILAILGEYLKLKKLLRGQDPQVEDNSVVIRNSKIQIENMTLNLLRQPTRGTRAISDAFSRLEDDGDISGVSIIQPTKTKPLLRVRRVEFPYFREDVASQPVPIVRAETKREVLVVVSPILDPAPEVQKRKWMFLRNGTYIRVRIADPAFLETVESGQPFRNGDRVEADIVISQEYNKSLAEYRDVDYTVTKIWHYMARPRQRQGHLFD